MKCSEFEQLIDDFWENNVPKNLKSSFSRHQKSCESCLQFFERSQKIRKIMSRVPKEKCPDNLIEDVFKKTIFKNTDWKNKVVVYFRSRLNRPGLIRFSFGFSLIILITAFIINSDYLTNRTKDDENFSRQEVKDAKDKVDYALSFVLGVTKKSESILENDIFPKNVYKTLKKGLKKVDIF